MRLLCWGGCYPESEMDLISLSIMNESIKTAELDYIYVSVSSFDLQSVRA